VSEQGGHGKRDAGEVADVGPRRNRHLLAEHEVVHRPDRLTECPGAGRQGEQPPEQSQPARLPASGAQAEHGGGEGREHRAEVVHVQHEELAADSPGETRTERCGGERRHRERTGQARVFFPQPHIRRDRAAAGVA
jgi:hypothetical protein